MNELQLQRWNQVSLGLAHSYTDLTPARKEKLLAAVTDCIDWVVCNGIENVEDWDSAVYKDGRLVEYSASTRVDEYLWDHRYEFERESKHEIEVVRGRFGDMLSSCVRAGFDMAVSPSAGVVGFTVGDLRGIFDGVIPDWITQRFDDPEALNAAGDAEGVWL